jgi:hypothetical protein
MDTSARDLRCGPRSIGVDIIAHTIPSSGPFDDATLAAMLEARVALIPTLKVWKHLLRHDRVSLGERSAGIGPAPQVDRAGAVRSCSGPMRAAWTTTIPQASTPSSLIGEVE